MKTQGNGFTLIEVLISAAILTTILASFAYLTKTGVASISTNKEYLKALNMAQSKMEEIRATQFDQIKNGSGVMVRNVSSDLLEIKIISPWREDKPPIELITLRSKY